RADARAGESRARGLRAQRPRGHRVRSRARVRALPAPSPALHATGWDALGRRAANVGDRPRAHGAANLAPARRAVDGPRADPGRDDLPHHPGHQPPGHDDLIGRAEIAYGDLRGSTWLRHADRTYLAVVRGCGVADV